MAKSGGKFVQSSGRAETDPEKDPDKSPFLRLRDALSAASNATQFDSDAYRVRDPLRDDPGGPSSHPARPGRHLVPSAATQSVASPGLSAMTRGVPRASAEHAGDVSSRSLGRPRQFLQDSIRESAPIATGRRWLMSILASSVFIAATGIVVWIGFVEWHSGPVQFEDLFAKVKSTLYSGRTLESKEAAGFRDRGDLVVKDQSGRVNEPIPLGITLEGGSGHEIVTLNGLAEGTQLSLGTTLSSTRWSLRAKDLDQTFIAAPMDFSGTMEVTATLYSPNNELLQTKVVRFRWAQETTQSR